MKSDKINIFYTDDDPDDVDFFKDAIDAAGSEVNLVARFDGDDLLHLLDNPPPYPSMIFLDWNMPGKDGAYLLKEIMANERKGKRGQENPNGKYKRAPWSAAQIAYKCGKNDERGWQNTGESETIQKLLIGHPGSCYHRIML